MKKKHCFYQCVKHLCTENHIISSGFCSKAKRILENTILTCIWLLISFQLYFKQFIGSSKKKIVVFFKRLMQISICIEVASAINQNVHKLHFETKNVCVKIIKTRIKTQINIIERKKNSIFK